MITQTTFGRYRTSSSGVVRQSMNAQIHRASTIRNGSILSTVVISPGDRWAP